MKITFRYVRHGETLFNQLERMQGWCDSPLTQRGIQQAKEARQHLLSIPLNRAFSSTSERCIDTANIILSGRTVPLVTTKGLKEVSFGRWEGEKSTNIQQELLLHRQTQDYSDVGGKSKEEIRRRIRHTFEQILAASNDQEHVLIVSHGAYFLQICEVLFHISKDDLIRRISLPQDYKGNPIVNGYVADFVYEDGSYRLTWMNGIKDISAITKQ